MNVKAHVFFILLLVSPFTNAAEHHGVCLQAEVSAAAVKPDSVLAGDKGYLSFYGGVLYSCAMSKGGESPSALKQQALKQMGAVDNAEVHFAWAGGNEIFLE